MQSHIAHLISQGRSGNQPDMVTAGKVIEAMNEWQPISTAPKDGPFIVFGTLQPHQIMRNKAWTDGPAREPRAYLAETGLYDGNRFSVEEGSVFLEPSYGEATHWMPLPEPPKA